MILAARSVSKVLRCNAFMAIVTRFVFKILFRTNRRRHLIHYLQSDREQALADIKNGTVHILIATDVASRGIDIEDITYVVNYDFPRNIEEYVHVSIKSISMISRK